MSSTLPPNPFPNPTTPPPEPGPRSPLPMPVVYVPTTWEYRHLERRLGEGPPITEQELDELGAEGWELVSVAHVADVAHFYFKRMRE
ncbi:MAG TPA: hypothetical protein VFX39_06295 [Gemmatimonadaceae bacterium]|jgi:hypothetical protein|nr:hypothetical protein [Gemmatimonadaceae bacterium]